MPDAVTNAEVEDVLSSIRRLVSEDKRVPAEQKPKASSDRLVLTPALRVAELPAREPDATEQVAAEEDLAVSDLDHAQHDFAKDDDVSSGDLSRNESDDDEEDVIGALMAETRADDDAAADEPAEDEEMLRARDETQAHVPDYAGDPVVGKEDGADEVIFTHRTMSDDTLTERRSLRDVFRAVDAQEADEARKAAVLPHVPEYRGPSIEPRVTPQSLSAKIAVLEEVIARTDDQWEPDGAGRDDYAGTEPPAMAWEDASDDTDVGSDAEDHTSAAPEATIFAGEPPRSETASEDVLSSDVDVLDEEALRDLVSDIVRQELQGALGERITRNVRKLVRREIHRALAAQELE